MYLYVTFLGCIGKAASMKEVEWYVENPIEDKKNKKEWHENE